MEEATNLRATAAGGLTRLIAEADVDELEVKRLEVTFMADGSVLWRAYPADGGETYGGLLDG